MNKKIHIVPFPAVILLLLVVVSVAVDAAESVRMHVDWVPDGDTFITSSGRTVRLAGIDAPETGREGKKGQKFAGEARNRLRELTGKKGVRIYEAPDSPDRYGRIIAVVHVDGGISVNEIMVKEGWAFYYPHPGQDKKLAGRLLQAQREAISGRHGFWGEILTLRLASKGWIGHKKSKRFHTMDCALGKRIARRNRIFFSHLEQAFRAGFAPSRECTFWPGGR